MNNYVEKPEAVFTYVPGIKSICIEFGIDFNDAKTITAMYEVFKRIAQKDRFALDEESYDEGYREGYNDAIGDAVSKLDGASWDLERLKKS